MMCPEQIQRETVSEDFVPHDCEVVGKKTRAASVPQVVLGERTQARARRAQQLVEPGFLLSWFVVVRPLMRKVCRECQGPVLTGANIILTEARIPDWPPRAARSAAMSTKCTIRPIACFSGRLRSWAGTTEGSFNGG